MIRMQRLLPALTWWTMAAMSIRYFPRSRNVRKKRTPLLIFPHRRSSVTCWPTVRRKASPEYCVRRDIQMTSWHRSRRRRRRSLCWNRPICLWGSIRWWSWCRMPQGFLPQRALMWRLWRSIITRSWMLLPARHWLWQIQ